LGREAGGNKLGNRGGQKQKKALDIPFLQSKNDKRKYAMLSGTGLSWQASLRKVEGSELKGSRSPKENGRTS